MKIQKNITEHVKTLEDAISLLGENDNEVIQLRKLKNVDVADYIISYQEAIIITKVLNEGWTPSWEDIYYDKYFPWFKVGYSGFHYYDCDAFRTPSTVGSRLCFKSPKLAEYAGRQFTDIYREFMTIE